MQVRCALFGGAIWCAGLAGGAAGQEFEILTSLSTYASVYDYYLNVDESMLATVHPSYVYDPSVRATTSIGYAEVLYTDTSFALAANTTSGGGFAAFSGRDLTVTEDALLLLEWDFSNAGSDRSVIEIRSTSGVVFTALTLAGSAEVALTAGRAYWVNVDVFTGDIRGSAAGDAFATGVLVPAPAAACVLGLAGLASTRRRRGVC